MAVVVTPVDRGSDRTARRAGGLVSRRAARRVPRRLLARLRRDPRPRRLARGSRTALVAPPRRLVFLNRGAPASVAPVAGRAFRPAFRRHVVSRPGARGGVHGRAQVGSLRGRRRRVHRPRRRPAVRGVPRGRSRGSRGWRLPVPSARRALAVRDDGSRASARPPRDPPRGAAPQRVLGLPIRLRAGPPPAGDAQGRVPPSIPRRKFRHVGGVDPRRAFRRSPSPLDPTQRHPAPQTSRQARTPRRPRPRRRRATRTSPTDPRAPSRRRRRRPRRRRRRRRAIATPRARRIGRRRHRRTTHPARRDDPKRGRWIVPSLVRVRVRVRVRLFVFPSGTRRSAADCAFASSRRSFASAIRRGVSRGSDGRGERTHVRVTLHVRRGGERVRLRAATRGFGARLGGTRGDGVARGERGASRVDASGARAPSRVRADAGGRADAGTRAQSHQGDDGGVAPGGCQREQRAGGGVGAKGAQGRGTSRRRRRSNHAPLGVRLHRAVGLRGVVRARQGTKRRARVGRATREPSQTRRRTDARKPREASARRVARVVRRVRGDEKVGARARGAVATDASPRGVRRVARLRRRTLLRRRRGRRRGRGRRRRFSVRVYRGGWGGGGVRSAAEATRDDARVRRASNPRGGGYSPPASPRARGRAAAR